MSTSEEIYGAKVYPNYITVVPNWVLEQPIMEWVNKETQEIEMLTIPQYYAKTKGNRKPVLLKGGTHSACTFEKSFVEDDFNKSLQLVSTLGLVFGAKDFTITNPNVAYDLTVSEYIELLNSDSFIVKETT